MRYSRCARIPHTSARKLGGQGPLRHRSLHRKTRFLKLFLDKMDFYLHKILWVATKDFLTVKKKYGIARLIMDFAIIAALMIILEGAGSIYISFLLVPLEVASMLITLANSDEQWKWGKYAVALPLSKKQIVSSRYAFAGIAAIIGLCVALVVNTISYFCFPAYQFGFYLFISAASFCVVLLFLAFILPSNYWLGVNAGFAVMFILIILLVVLGIWSRVTDNAIMGFVVENFDLSMIIGFISTIILFALSYILSITLFKRKYA